MIDAISSEALRRGSGVPEQHGHTHGVVQSFWALSLVEAARASIAQRLASHGSLYDVAFAASALLDGEWARSSRRSCVLWLVVRDVVCSNLLAGLIEDCVLGTGPVPFEIRATSQRYGFSGLSRYHRDEYRKLAALVEYLHEEVGGPSSPEAVLAAMARFSQSDGRWLKVAAGEKSACLEGLAARSTHACRGASLMGELGAFVGYSAVLAARSAPPGARLRSLELDPVHVAVARFAACLAAPGAAELAFAVGHAADALPGVAEDYGARMLAFLFMDHCNSRFHEERDTIDRLQLDAVGAEALADNVLKPGAPIFAWRALHRGVGGRGGAVAWSLAEFLHEDQEDWMVATGAAAPRGLLPARPGPVVAGKAPERYPRDSGPDEGPAAWRRVGAACRRQG